MPTRPLPISIAALTGGTTGTIPACQGGDMLRILSGAAISGAVDAAGAGFKLGVYAGTTGRGITMLYKFASGSVGVTSPDVGAAVTVSNPGSPKRQSFLQVIRGVDTYGPFATDPVAVDISSASANRVLAAQTVDQPDVLEIADVLYLAGGGTQLANIAFPAGPPGLTRRLQGFSTAGASPSALATGDSDTRVIADNGTFGPFTIVGDQTGTGSSLHYSLAPITPTTHLTIVSENLGSWAAVAAATGVIALNDGTNTTYIRTPDNPVGVVYRGKLSNPGTPASARKFGLDTLLVGLSGAGSSSSLTAVIRQGGGTTLGGGTARMTRTLTNPTLNTTIVDVADQLMGTPAEASAVTDWSDLYLELTASAA